VTTTRARLSDAQLAALARAAFGLVPGLPQLPDADAWEDAEGVLVAVREAGVPVVREVPRWRSPGDVRALLAARGWAGAAAWVGRPPEDRAGLPARLLVLVPAGGTAPDSAVLAATAAAWRSGEHPEVLVVPVPVTPAAPELTDTELAAAYGAELLGSRVAPGTPGTGGLAVVFTGLSGSGKSTIAGRLTELLAEAGRTVTLLDGDVVRTHLSAGLGFSQADRDTNVRRIGWVAAQIAKHGGVAVCAPIAPYAATRAEVRAEVQAQAGAEAFLLVHVATPLAECEARDRKGLYARARRGEIPEFTGISAPYQLPTDADLTIDTSAAGIDECAQVVLGEVLRRLPAPAGR